MNKRTIDEMIAYFNQEVSNMDISRKDKMTLLGMITAIGYESKKQEVVRCKDCSKRHGEIQNYKGETLYYFCENGTHKPDWFCADGERKKCKSD